jgi:hypothetical protein
MSAHPSSAAAAAAANVHTAAAAAMGNRSAVAVGRREKRGRPDEAQARRVHPRHFHTGPNPVPGDDMLAALQDNASTSPPPTAARLYRHALESVFAFCKLEELAPLLLVSKEWAAAVNSMHSLDAELPKMKGDSCLLRFCMSPLARHVTRADRRPPLPLSCWSLCHLKLRLPNLRLLSCRFDGSWLPLMFPARLRNLEVWFHAAAASFSDNQLRALDEAIVVIASLPLLEELLIYANRADSCCLTPLATAPSLHTLQLWVSERVLDSSANIEALRAMPHLRSLDFRPSAAGFTRMLQPPHTMKLDTLNVSELFTAEHGEAIVQLPTLTNLSINMCSPHTDFLCHLPNLRRLLLFTRNADGPADAARIMQSMHSLTRLTELSLLGSCEFPLRITSAHLAACLPLMPLLTSLRLTDVSALDSLRFLSSGPITRLLIVTICSKSLDHFELKN